MHWKICRLQSLAYVIQCLLLFANFPPIWSPSFTSTFISAAVLKKKAKAINCVTFVWYVPNDSAWTMLFVLVGFRCRFYNLYLDHDLRVSTDSRGDTLVTRRSDIDWFYKKSRHWMFKVAIAFWSGSPSSVKYCICDKWKWEDSVADLNSMSHCISFIQWVYTYLSPWLHSPKHVTEKFQWQHLPEWIVNFVLWSKLRTGIHNHWTAYWALVHQRQQSD